MQLTDLFEAFKTHAAADAIVWHDQAYSYGWLTQACDAWREKLDRHAVKAGTVVVLEADFSPAAVALFLALAERRCILVPLTQAAAYQRDEFLALAQGELCIGVDARDEPRFERLNVVADHEHYRTLRELQAPGLVLFSSGSTGRSKGVVQNLAAILRKFKITHRPLRAISFLLYDHIGGINTMLFMLSCGGCLVTVRDRSPDGVLAAIEKQRVELLPTSPTFINLILLSGDHEKHDLSSLKVVTYGTEPMPESTLTRFHALFPNILLRQTYGLSEVGIMQSQSRRSDSLWMKLGGAGFETRVVDDVLHVKAASAMLGYLNAPSPFMADGWMNTGDLVETDGEYVRILGRKSELINVGGEKVYPAEVESVIQELDNVAEATVFGEKSPIMGQIVCAEVRLTQPEDSKAFARRLKKHCAARLAAYKVPVRVMVADRQQHGVRFKKLRRGVRSA